MAESAAERIKRLIAERKSKDENAKTQASGSQEVRQDNKQSNSEVRKADVSIADVRNKVIEAAEKLNINIQPTVVTGSEPIHMMLAELEQALYVKNPNFFTVLRDIHQHLGKDPAIVTILKDEEIALIIKGLEKHGDLTIVEPKAAGGRGKTKTQPVTADML